LLDSLAGYIEHFTYVGLFAVLTLCGLGLPLPEDAALLTGGWLAHRGVTRLPLTVAVGLAGVLTGDCALYFLGRRFGPRVIRYVTIGHPAAEARVEWIRGFMDRHGHRTIFYARFLAGMRALVFITAGSMGVSPARFVFFDGLGALISVPLVVVLGYTFGDELERIVEYIGGVETVVVVLLAVAALFYTTRLWAARAMRSATT
jgi:membrane protein DedA with SNARE-associated domain